MTTEAALAPTEADDRRRIALLKAIGLDKLSPEQRELAVNLASRYDLDLLLKHLVMIEGRAYITRDGLIHVAHRSGVFDGIEVTDPELVGEFWRARASVYRRDMSRPFTYGGRYPKAGSNQKYAPEMAVKVAEVAALRRAFDVSAPTVEERWEVEQPETEPEPKKTLAERVAEKREVILNREEVAEGTEPLIEASAAAASAVQPEPAATALCLAEDKPLNTGRCELPAGHRGEHRNAIVKWPA